MTMLVSGLIDVFAEAPLTGNPLAVVEGADDLPEATMRCIARELNQAETTFIMRSPHADRKLRSFTASGSEVFGAGHNALGAWLWLAERGHLGPLQIARTFHQEIGRDVLPVTLERHSGRLHGRMRQSALTLSATVSDVGALAHALSLDARELVADPPPRVADTGAAHLLVRLRARETVDRAQPVAEKLLAALRAAGAEGCYVYAFDCDSPGCAYARFFNPTVGLWEDAATGTAAGPLAAYLGSQGLLAAEPVLVVEQGVLMGRRSLLHVRLAPEPVLSGTGVVSFRGELALT